MKYFNSDLARFFKVSIWFSIFVVFIPTSLLAQNMMSSGMSCSMCSTMGWGAMILGGLLVISLIAVCVALTIFLVNRIKSGPSSHVH